MDYRLELISLHVSDVDSAIQRVRSEVSVEVMRGSFRSWSAGRCRLYTT